ncbi:2-oxoglutarate ferredoxin oxidoreductase subunit beta [Desulfotomaculum arcticum]|uniref:2-oxoglutarate ferredoxin oxidoreductase subunit beta n=1 Tax=Desulfotruncus arcticus DSM 17038 TaxID=1121424 RepID=A0A1I2Q057_9FIRM|nr:2-oxoacid:ferredoxin oxidoreductase subunit beta [Desulfotruncus arcticus]SFG21724.1 2-oxoglutarate ferredoxin oxidoreductase subunit beta [Desulfotomaculum arcticum] [Desulfotruncus arcticus DSM 17038]
MMQDLEKYLRVNMFPHMWCPGCGNGIVLSCLLRAVDKLDLDQDRTVIVGGIGCSSRAAGYLDFNTLHTTHGRALAFATGIKLAKPELNVIVITGDGDCTAIGGNHFIHAARRNIDITVLLFNNSIYGMTGGQYSPLTPVKKMATTAPYGTVEPNFDVAELASASGATFVARSTTYHSTMLTGVIAEGITHKGFSLVEAVTACPTAYGRKNKMKSAADMLMWQKDNSIHLNKAEKMTPEELAGKIVIGKLFHKEAPEYTELYNEVINKARGQNSGSVANIAGKGGNANG